jgi:tetratricopeptide (TPR) repeat protein
VLSIIQEADPAASRRTREADIAQLVATEHRVENEFKHRPELALPLRLAIGVAYRNRGDFVRARQILRTAIDEAAGVVPAGNEDLLKATIQYAATLAELGEPLSEGAGLDKVIEALRQLGGRAAPALVDALIARSAHRVIAFEEDAAFDDAKEAHETARHALSADDERRLSAAEAFARRLLIGFQTQRALEVLETAQATAAKQPRLASSHPAVIQAKSSYGIALCMSGRSQEGIEVLKDSLGAARASHGGASHVAVRSLESLAEGFRCGGHLKQALATYREMWAIVDANAGLAHIRHLRRTGWMHALLESRRPEEARPDFEEFERSIVSMPASKAREHHRSMLETTRAILLLGLGDTRQAETLLRERLVALAPKSAMLPRLALGFTLMQNGKLTESREVLAGLRGAIAGRPSPDLWMPQALANSALLELELNQPEQALEFAREALAICARQNRPSVPFVADLHIARGRALLMLGRATEARDSLRKADEFWRDFDPDSPWSAEAAYWHGQSLVATGEIARGKNMIGEMRPRLAASPLPLHRALASPFPPAKRAG